MSERTKAGSFEPLSSAVKGSSVPRPEEDAPRTEAPLDTPARDRIPLSMLADSPVVGKAADRLGFEHYANALTSLITDPDTSTPLTIAINGPWGSGKSSLGRMLDGKLRDAAMTETGEHGHVTCWFNAWMHDDAEDLSAAFASTVAETADRHRSFWRRLLQPVPSSLLSARRRARRGVWRGVLLLVLVVTGLTALAQTDFGLAILAERALQDLPELPQIPQPAALGIAIAIVALGVLRYVLEAARSIREFVADPAAAAQQGRVQDVSSQLRALIHQATHADQRFVIFIDDLERCRPPRGIELLEVVNLLLGHERVVTVIMADLPAVAAAATLKYQNLAQHLVDGDGGSEEGRSQLRSYGRHYLQKIIQLQFDLPRQRRERMQELFAHVSAERQAGGAGLTEDASPTGPGLKAAARRWTGSLATRFAAVRDRIVDLPFEPRYVNGVLVGVVVLLMWDEIDTFGFVMAGVVGGALLVTEIVRPLLLAWRRRHAISQIERAHRSGVPEERLPDAVDVRGLTQQEREGLVRDFLYRKRVDPDSPIWRAAEEEAQRHLPELPRNAKRLVNRLRMMLSVAQHRGLISAEEPTASRRIGKWCVLWERWPEVAQEVITRDGLMGELEHAARIARGEHRRSVRNRAAAAFSGMVADVAPMHAADGDLVRFCASDPPLADHVSTIIHLDAPEPAVGAGAEIAAAEESTP